MRFAEKDSRSSKFAIFRAADNIKKVFLDLEGFLRMLALRVTWPSFGNTSVHTDIASVLWNCEGLTKSVRLYSKIRIGVLAYRTGSNRT
jgi:hypothetical protein